MGEETPSQTPLEKTLSIFLDESPRYLKTLREPFEGKSLEIILFSSPTDPGQKIILNDFYPFQTVQEIKTKIFTKMNQPQFHPYHQCLLIPLDDETQLNTEYIPIDFLWTVTSQKLILTNPFRRIGQGIDQRFVSSSGQRKVVGFADHSRMTIEDVILKTREKLIFTFHLFLYKDIERLIMSPRPFSEIDWYGYINPFFPSLSPLLRGEIAADQKAEIEAYKSYIEKTKVLIELYEILLTGKELIQLKMAGIRYMRLVWTQPPDEDRRSLENLFYEIPATTVRPFLRFLPTEGTPVTKIKINGSIKTPDISDPKLLFQWAEERNPTPDNDFLLVKSMIRNTQGSTPAFYGTLRLYQDSTADYILQPPKMLRRFDPRSDLVDFTKYLEETIADTYLQNRSPEIGEATVICGIRISRDEAIIKREDLRKRLHVMSPFFQEITPLPGDQPLLMIRYKAISNFATEDRINVFLTQLARRRLQEGIIDPKAYVDDVIQQFQLNRQDAERRVEAWLKRSAEMTPTSATDSKDYTSMYNKGIDIAIFAQHPFYSFHIYGIDSILIFRRLLTLLSLLLSSKNDELYAPETLLQSVGAADNVIQGQAAKVEEESEPQEESAVPDWAADLMFDPFSGDVQETEGESASLKERVQEERVAPSEELSQVIQAPPAKKFGRQIQEETPEEELQRKKTFANYFLRKLQEADKRLFDYNKTHPSVKQYATMCQANDTRQPIVMSQDQYDAMIEVYGEDKFVRHGYDPQTKEPFEDEAPDTGEYVNVLVYGSDPLRINYYICCNLFCVRDYIVVFQEDFNSTFDYEGREKPTKTCPFCHGLEITNRKTPGKNETVFKKTVKPKTENKKHIYVGFLKKKSHPEGLFLPCCFVDPQTTIKASGEAFQPFAKRTQQTVPPVQQQSAQPFLDYEITLRRAYKKYILGPEKFPLEMSDREGPQVGLLPQALDTFFDQNPINMVSRDFNRMELKPNSRGFLRIGVENQQRYQNDSFLASLAPYMMPHVNTINDVKSEIKKVITPQVFVHLNYGNLLLEFYKADYPVPEDINWQDWASSKTSNLPVDWKPTNEEYIVRIYKSYHNFLDYLEQDTKLKEYRHFAQLLADESLLTPRGIVFMVIDISEKNEVSVRCPPYGYDIEKHDKCDIGILLHDWRGIWEPIFYVENKSATATQKEEHVSEIRFQQAVEADWSQILRKRVNEFRTRCATMGKAMFTSQQGIDSNAILSPSQVITKLGKKAYPVGIVKDAYNHSVAITLRLPKGRNNLISIPIVDDGNLRYMWLKIHLDWDDYAPAPADDIYTFFKNVVNVEFPNYPGYQIIRRVTSTGEGGQLKAFQLRNGIYIPVGQPNSETEIASLPTVSESEREWIINKQIYFDQGNQVQQSEKLLLAEQRDMDEIYQHLRYTFGNWISTTPEEELRARLEKVIFRKELPLFEKRKRLFILLNTDIRSWFDTDSYKREEVASLLRVDCILRAEPNCNGRCVWRQSVDVVKKGKCLLHSPKEMSVGGRKVDSVQLFIFRIIDELLRFPDKRKQLLEKDVSALVTLKEAVVIGKEKDQYIVPENSSAWFNLMRLDWMTEQKEQPLFFEELSGLPPTTEPRARVRESVVEEPVEAPVKPRVFKVAGPLAPVAAPVVASAASAPVASAPVASAPVASAPVASAPLAPLASAQVESAVPLTKSRVFKIVSSAQAPTSEYNPFNSFEALPAVSARPLPSNPFNSPEASPSVAVSASVLPSANQVPGSPLFEFEPELNADSELEPLPEPLPQSLPVPLPEPLPESLPQSLPEPLPQSLPEPLPAPTAKTRVFKVAKASIPVSVPSEVPASEPQSLQSPSRSKTLMKIASRLRNLEQSGKNLQNTLGSMEGVRQRYNVEFPVEEEELAKLDEQFKTLQIRPSGLSAVPGANFQENQQKLISLMQEAELENQGEGTVEEVNESESESKNERNFS